MADSSPRFPIDPHLPEIAQALQKSPRVILKAEPGAGKTTRVPLELLKHFKSILVVEPRRLAAKLSAEYVAGEAGSDVGGLVGYQIRMDTKRSAGTRLLYITEGVLTRFFMQDPQLSAFDVVVLDEFHERHLHTDIALALVKKLQSERPELKLLVMSATLEQNLLRPYLGQDTPSFDIPGRVFPVAVEYRPSNQHTPLPAQVSAAVREMLEDERCGGNILVFLAGMAQINRSAEELSRWLKDADIIPLSAEQSQNYNLITKNPERRKVILSTNVAETSLTMPNVKGVIDAGTARILAYAPWSGLPTLEEKKISQASSVQRSGRAGRVSSGVCYRLYSESDFHARAKFSEPEIQRIELSQIILELQGIYPEQPFAWESLEWLERPRSGIVEQNIELLIRLGAMNAEGLLTDIGARMAELPMHPRLARIALSGEKDELDSHALLLALILGEGGILAQDAPASEHLEADATFQLKLYLQRLARMNPRPALDPAAVQRVQRSCEQILKRRVEGQVTLEPEAERSLRYAMFLAFADRVAKHRPLADTGYRRQRHFNFALGRGGVLADSSVVQDAEWILAVEAKEAYGEDMGRVTSAAKVEPEWLREDPFGFIEEKSGTELDPRAGRPRFVERIFYGKLLVEEQWSDNAEGSRELLLAEVKKRWPDVFEDSDALAVYHRKVDLLDKSGITHNLPKFEDDFLELLIDAACEKIKSLRELKKKSLAQLIQAQLDYTDLELLKRMCPDSVKLFGGRVLKVHYEDEPWIASRIQDFFGTKQTPTICSGRHTLLLKLLAPSQRPAQITRDLAGFWAGSYVEVKKELKRRYPRQPWPDDPANFVMPPREPRRG